MSLALTTAAPSLAESEQNSPQAANSVPQERFRCDLTQDTPSTIVTGMVTAENPDPIPFINWSSDYFDSEEKALSLCQNVSRELQTFYEEGQLSNLSLVAGELNGEAVVCLQGEAGSMCERDRVLFSLDTNQSPQVALYELIGPDFKPPRTRGDFPTRIDKPFLNFF